MTDPKAEKMNFYAFRRRFSANLNTRNLLSKCYHCKSPNLDQKTHTFGGLVPFCC
ncbi:hypothetical protein [Sodalis phage phiSG1]|uniref:hypothetical protein n=1 Tax=Sodalis phage phiSG1 TaxID=373126 RepID=UPI00006C5BF7|nr:hypothetical protein SGPHI_0014 [Sodalis phage phiSG1]BAE80477.1 hypothetical protein [Sodalis phage phiSG1]